ncbi:hypothetical protein P3X46_010016 [Hevea brasiliensis]|uniref:Cyclic nucleotide-binding domain-containing protein n=1 Tax=Hevea brasiliensis TaxID=3981 RepID=A0ABQ9MGS3_HEVBR|nr:hypothetical protein P3X46_010016 [Hevea brasiliensis]
MSRLGSSRFARNRRHNVDETNKIPEESFKKAATKKMGKSLRAKVLSRVFSEDYERTKNKILDPNGQTLHQWNKIFLTACLVSLFVDPLFLYLPIMREEFCIDYAVTLRTVLTVIRSLLDVFYVIQIFVRFHTAYVAPSSQVLGRGELVIDSSKIALRYLRKGFWIDLITSLPVPQVLVWAVIPHINGWGVFHSMNVLWFISIIQFLPRLYLILPLSSQLVEETGVVTKTALTAAVYNYLIFLLAANAFGACWYILSTERQEDCWHWVCNIEMQNCPNEFFDCRKAGDPARVDWFQSSNITYNCNPLKNLFPFGIMGWAVTNNVQGSSFLRKYFYCLWWGLQNMSTLGQSFTTSTYVGENVFAVIITTTGLVFLALLIGNVQRYLQSTTKRLEVWKIQRSDTEQWMHHRHLPPGLRQSVRKYDQYKWLNAKGVDEEDLIKSLPVDLQKKVKRHLCFDLLRKVPLIDEMDENMLDAICERLKPALCAKGMFLVKEGDPVNQMLFIIRGHLDSYSTDITRTRFFNLCRICPGDFCGEELLTWALDPRPGIKLPLCSRTVKAINEVEAFTLRAEDLKFVASQFRKLHSKELRHKFRFYSHQWRIWAACTIQAAWRRHKTLKEIPNSSEPGMPRPGSFWSDYAESLVASTRWRNKYKQSETETDQVTVNSIEKPEEPDFSEEE